MTKQLKPQSIKTLCEIPKVVIDTTLNDYMDKKKETTS